MTKRPGFKADLAIFALIIFLGGIAFSMFVLEKEPDARLGLFGISIWVLVIVGAFYLRQKRKKNTKDED